MNFNRVLLGVSGLFVLANLVSCGYTPEQPSSTSGVQKVNVQVAVDPTTGKTIEQTNIEKRLLLDNKVGSIKHLYIIAPTSGQVLMSVQETFCKSGQKGETSVNLSIARKKDNRWSYKMIAQNTSKGISWKYCQRAVWSA